MNPFDDFTFEHSNHELNFFNATEELLSLMKHRTEEECLAALESYTLSNTDVYDSHRLFHETIQHYPAYFPALWRYFPNTRHRCFSVDLLTKKCPEESQLSLTGSALVFAAHCDNMEILKFLAEEGLPVSSAVPGRISANIHTNYFFSSDLSKACLESIYIPIASPLAGAILSGSVNATAWLLQHPDSPPLDAYDVSSAVIIGLTHPYTNAKVRACARMAMGCQGKRVTLADWRKTKLHPEAVAHYASPSILKCQFQGQHLTAEDIANLLDIYRAAALSRRRHNELAPLLQEVACIAPDLFTQHGGADTAFSLMLSDPENQALHTLWRNHCAVPYDMTPCSRPLRFADTKFIAKYLPLWGKETPLVIDRDAVWCHTSTELRGFLRGATLRPTQRIRQVSRFCARILKTQNLRLLQQASKLGFFKEENTAAMVAYLRENDIKNPTIHALVLTAGGLQEGLEGDPFLSWGLMEDDDWCCGATEKTLPWFQDFFDGKCAPDQLEAFVTAMSINEMTGCTETIDDTHFTWENGIVEKDPALAFGLCVRDNGWYQLFDQQGLLHPERQVDGILPLTEHGTSTSMTPLCYAAFCGCESLVRYLLEQSGDPNQYATTSTFSSTYPDPSIYSTIVTPLFCAVLGKQAGTAKLLLDAGAQWNPDDLKKLLKKYKISTTLSKKLGLL